MTREEYINQQPLEKEKLVFSYYKKMVQGMICYLFSSIISLSESEFDSLSDSIFDSLSDSVFDSYSDE